MKEDNQPFSEKTLGDVTVKNAMIVAGVFFVLRAGANYLLWRDRR